MLQWNEDRTSSGGLDIVSDTVAETSIDISGRRRAVRQPVAELTPDGPRVSAVIPAMNEAENLPYTFSRLPDGLYEVILVDGHSRDDTVAVAKRLRPDVRIVTQSGKGKGNAMTARSFPTRRPWQGY